MFILITSEQQSLIDAVQSVHVACTLSGQSDLDISVVYHHHACNNLPGYNIFMNNLRFELGYEHSVVRFSLPPDEDKYLEFKKYLTEKLGFNNFSENYKVGIKYVFEVEFGEIIYAIDGIERISKLTSKILEYA